LRQAVGRGGWGGLPLLVAGAGAAWRDRIELLHLPNA
jgi:hypothetical protein